MLKKFPQKYITYYKKYLLILEGVKFRILKSLFAIGLILFICLSKSIFALADTCYDLPSAYARNMLIHFGLITYDEPVYFPLGLNSSSTWQNPFKEIDFPKSSSLSLFPNPAGDYFIIEYAIERSYEQAMIVIHDMKGKLVRNFYVKGNHNQIVIPTGDLNNGVYIVSLYLNNKLEDSNKITLLK